MDYDFWLMQGPGGPNDDSTDYIEDDEMIKDGLHFGVPFATYLSWPVYSQSTLKEARNSMAHLLAARERERVKVPTDDMILGSALHTAFLEPEEASDRVLVWRGGARRGKEWEEFKVNAGSKIIITEAQNIHLSGMVASLKRAQIVRKWLDAIEDVEVSVIGNINGLPMKARCDALTSEPLIDLKKVADASPRKVMNAVIDFGYDVQGAIYSQLFGRDRFLLVCVEDEPPYDVVPYELSPAFLRAGRRKADRWIAQVLECERTGVWPGRSAEICQLEVPEWMTQETESLLEI